MKDGGLNKYNIFKRLAVFSAIAAVIAAVGLSIILSTMGIVGYSRLWSPENYEKGGVLSLRGAMIDEYRMQPVTSTALSAKINGKSLIFSQAIEVPCHQYDWDSSKVNPMVINFLETSLK